MNEEKSTLKEAIKYLKPIADSSTMPSYTKSLKALLNAAEELEFTRDFICNQGLEFALADAWNKRKLNVDKKESLISKTALLNKIECGPVPEEYWHDERDKAYAKWLVNSMEEV